jgi:uracil-DNA glycosylase
MSVELSFEDSTLSWENTSFENFLVYNTPSKWKAFFDQSRVKQEVSSISEALLKVKGVIHPSIENVLRSLYLTDPETLKCVILGQDPYHNGSAVGLAFSVKKGNRVNPSLVNMYKELEKTHKLKRKDGDIHHWAEQGILLINTALTVKEASPGSHCDMWDKFTEYLFDYINTNTKNTENMKWLLFGTNAYNSVNILNTNRNYLNLQGNFVRASHPSPLSAYKGTAVAPAFLGSGIFNSVTGIEW